MILKQHRYEIALTRTGNRGVGTASYRSYGRDYEIRSGAKPVLAGSSDPAYRGDAARWNPEELLLAALSACHQLWYLHLCADAGVTVLGYEDRAEGWITEDEAGAGQFTRVLLHPHGVLAPGVDETRALALHHEAHAKCLIARSMNFPVAHEPVFSWRRDAFNPGSAGSV